VVAQSQANGRPIAGKGDHTGSPLRTRNTQNHHCDEGKAFAEPGVGQLRQNLVNKNKTMRRLFCIASGLLYLCAEKRSN
jgi:hypothetical protein